MTAVVATRRGMSLVELLISLTLFAVIITAALRALDVEGRAFAIGTDRMGAVQNYRYALNVLEKDLRTAGAGVPAHQPFLIYLSEDAVAFNADYATNVPGDVFAVYSDTSAPDALVSALTPLRRIQIPGSSFGYPDTTYRVAGTNSPAETILFFFAPDSTTERPDDYVLRRQVNDAPPEVVARNILRADTTPFFAYLRLDAPPDSAARIAAVSPAELPLRHAAPIHLAPEDTGRFARIDSVRAVRVGFLATDGRTGADERTMPVSRLIRLPNAGLAAVQSCGDEPILGVVLDARPVTVPATGESAVQLEWGPASDETGGEADVIRYVLWRRAGGALDWGDPFVSIPAGNATYSYLDTRVEAGTSYSYALAAQDCTPSLSGLAVSPTVSVP